jgi:GH25 family lysozyme M1 (1,4-beta-N-acetylmuramidase)
MGWNDEAQTDLSTEPTLSVVEGLKMTCPPSLPYAPSCHSEQSEESAEFNRKQILHFVQDDK